MDLLSLFLVGTGTLVILLSIGIFAILITSLMGKSISDPSYHPVVGTIFHQLVYFHRLFDYLADLSRKHPTFRLIAPFQSEIYTVDPRNVEHILKTSFDNYPKGQHCYEIVHDLFGDGIFGVDGEKWRRQRKLASFGFSTRVLRDFSCAIFRTNAAKLAQIVKDFAAEKMAFDIQDLLMKCALDSIFEVGFGVKLNCLDGSSEAGNTFCKAFDESNGLVYWRFPDAFWKIKKVLNVGSEAKLKGNIKSIDAFLYDLIRNKRQMPSFKGNNSDKKDILALFLLESEKDPESMNDQYLRDIILNFIIAGKDTTASTLSWFFYMLCRHPLIQEKISQQVNDVIKDQRNINDFVGELTDATLDKMHFLHAALTETLRLYPAVPIDRKCAEVDDVLPDGFKLKKGDGINYFAYGMGRTKSIWGEDAEEFRPERWLEDGIFRPESPFKFVAFHAGPRICLGKEFAYRQMKIIAMVLLRFFRFQLNDEKKEVKYRTMFTLHIDGGLQLRALSRLS
ncbi:cytochrome P450 704C1-like [Aristolochia californica]|uniref:cytochrome P450 704C1-like n=1 Tax=Aristolochia californica TaxID=171875 RepID=UPI0035D99425